jgi:hypothetical protein
MATAKIIQAWHNRLHSIISTLDHSSAATPGRILRADGNGLPVESTNTDAELADAVAKRHTQNTDTNLGAVGVKNPPIDADKVIQRDSAAGDALVTSTWTQVKAFLKTYFDTLYGTLGLSHTRLHSITSALDHSSAATPSKMLKADANGLPVDASNTDAEVASAVSLKHTQGTDVALGAVGVKNPPIDADKVLYRNSAAADALVTSTWTQIKAFLKTYLDTLYAALAHNSRHGYLGADEIPILYLNALRAVPVWFKSWTDLTGFTAAHLGGVAYANLWYLNLNSGSTSGNYGLLRTNNSLWFHPSMGNTIGTLLNPRQSTNHESFYGFFGNTTPSLSQNHICINIRNNEIYACVGKNAIDRVESLLTTYSGVSEQTIGINYGNTTNGVRFYRNHTLAYQVTNTAVIPSSLSMYLIIYVTTTEDVNKQFFVFGLSLFTNHAH